MKGCYLTKGVLDVLDKMDKKRYGKIINGLQTAINIESPYKDKILIGKNDMNISTLKQVLGDLQSIESYEAFVHSFNIWSNHLPPETSKEIESMQKKLVGKNDNVPLIKFSDDFWILLDKISDEICWSIYDLESNRNIKNPLGIEKIDVSDKYNTFNIVIKGKPCKISVNQFLRQYFPNKFSDKEVSRFLKSYNKIVGQYSNRPSGNRIQLPEFKYNPKDVRSTFLSLVTETYPYGTEEGVMKYMPKDLTKDEFGNYYKIVGDGGDTMFTSHLDTASRTKDRVTLISYTKEKDEFICTDGTSILGADDKAGVTVMLYMIAHNIPGVYFFFYGEERGGIGSSKVSANHYKYPFLKKIKKCISFDRRNYYSVVTAQMSVECCSYEFATSLCQELNKSGLKLNLDPTGVFTDSANFTDIIPECTNISVGYFNEHTHDEVQNISYLERLAKACVEADWSKLIVKRRVGFDDELMSKYSKFLEEFKKSVFYNNDNIKGHEGKITITMEIDDYRFEHFEKDMSILDFLFRKYNIDPDIKFSGDKIKFEIK